MDTKELTPSDLKRGGVYLRRDGTKTPPLEKSPNDLGVFGWLFDSEKNLDFDPDHEDGCLVYVGDENPSDLVAEA